MTVSGAEQSAEKPHATSTGESAHHNHIAHFGVAPAFAESAPITWSLIGEHVDLTGGIVLICPATPQVSIAASARSDNNIRVSVNGSEPEQLAMGDIHDTAQAAENESGTPGASGVPGVPGGGGRWVEHLGGVLWSLIHRQLLPRDTPGYNISVETDIPSGWGLGVHAAAEIAFAAGLVMDEENSADYPLRVRVAEACYQSARVFSATPPLRARYTALLRHQENNICVIDYRDDSVTQIPQLGGRGVRIFAVNTADNPSVAAVDELARRIDFVTKATRAFGASSLRHLPDAAPRVRDWLEAVHKVHGPNNVPSLQEATRWLEFFDHETQRAQSLIPLVRSRNIAEISHVLASSQYALGDGYSITGTDHALAQLCRSRGAISARSAHAGVSNAVMALVDAAHAHNFAADLREDGLSVIELA